MARYIDVDAINADVVQNYTANADVFLGVRKILGDAPTADVVSREEYEAVVAAQESLQKYIAELVREKSEIFAEIDKLIVLFVDEDGIKYPGVDYDGYLGLKQKYTEGKKKCTS